MSTTTTNRKTPLMFLSDQDLEREAERLQRALDRLDGATWPAASLQREQIRDALLCVQREFSRRRV